MPDMEPKGFQAILYFSYLNDPFGKHTENVTKLSKFVKKYNAVNN